jgi:hypothetical protein
MLKHVEADRKSIFLFSDGLAEDKAYYHQDVINAARKSNVIITGIGYPRSVSQSVALQTLRRLSEETGGLFIEADNKFNLPQGFLAQPYESIDNGEKLLIDLKPVVTTAKSSDIRVNLTFETDTSDTTISLSAISLYQPGETKVPAATGSVLKNLQAASAPIKIITVQPQQSSSFDKWLWYGIPIALVVLLMLTVTTFYIIIQRQQIGNKRKDANYSDFKPYAYLVVQDETKKRYPITQTTWRIGRSKDNELTLRDNSISRRHAEIHRDIGDIFTIIDLESLNGVFVNNEKIEKTKLREGDIVEIGDVAMRFTLLSDDYQLEESTVMQQTKVPMTH